MDTQKFSDLIFENLKLTERFCNKNFLMDKNDRALKETLKRNLSQILNVILSGDEPDMNELARDLKNKITKGR